MTRGRTKIILPALALLFAVLILVNNSGGRKLAASTQTAAIDPAAAKNAFEHFKKLEGIWAAKSTKGWEEKATFKTIAAGSIVIEEGVNAHPGETMLTVFHLDGDRLMLTHYCVAKNQPRLVATSVGDNGRTVTFTFLDATNLSSRDNGHMDNAVYQFTDDNHFTAQWTWYQNGSEQWMEKIESKGVRGGDWSR